MAKLFVCNVRGDSMNHAPGVAGIVSLIGADSVRVTLEGKCLEGQNFWDGRGTVSVESHKITR